jgi:pullulanase/glycogen debranching enzyme
LNSPQTLWTIESDPILAGTKIITINFITCHDGFTLNDLVS